jgi:hypothetical protein
MDVYGPTGRAPPRANHIMFRQRLGQGVRRLGPIQARQGELPPGQARGARQVGRQVWRHRGFRFAANFTDIPVGVLGGQRDKWTW